MQKENVFKGVLSALLAGATAYFRVMGVPVVVLISVMVVDYISGMTKAWLGAGLSSKVGVRGIVKKLCYMLVVIVAAIVDWLMIAGLRHIGIEMDHTYYFGIVVTVWLIINELISILENLSAIGIPMPEFLKKVVKRLKTTVEKAAEVKEEEKEEHQ